MTFRELPHRQEILEASDIDTALDPYLYQIAEEMKKYCKNRKTVVFLPLVKTSQKFKDILNEKGFKAAEVNGNSEDRTEILQDFENDKYNVLCNSMLLTEGWDCPSVNCVVVFETYKGSGGFTAKRLGRGTRHCSKQDGAFATRLFVAHRKARTLQTCTSHLR